MLQTGTLPQRASALEVVATWRLTLTAEEVAALARGGDQRLKLRLLHYIEMNPSRTYREVVAELARDADAMVADTAANTLGKLTP
jgi:hypothetical protein